MLLLGLELKTGGAFGAPIEANFITEIGLVLWDTEFSQPVELLSLLFRTEQRVGLESIEHTGINNELLERHGHPLDIRSLQPIINLMKKADYIVAHDGNEFFRPLITTTFENYGFKLPTTPWLDTKYDIEYPRACTSRDLIYITGFHGLVNPFPHRSATNALTILTILSRYDIQQVITNSQRAWLIVQANVSYDERDKAKDKGFRWQTSGGKTYERSWVKRIPEEQLSSLQRDCDFNLTVLEKF